jgi:electron transfer flavoprotein alpha subunit
MLSLRSTAVRSVSRRSYATITTPNTLLLLEHRDNQIVPATLNAVTAAKSLGGNVTGLIVGEQGSVDGVVDMAKKYISFFSASFSRVPGLLYPRIDYLFASSHA